MRASRISGLQLSARRVIAFIILSLAALALALLYITSSPPAISLTDGGATVYFAATRTQILPKTCAKFEWNIDHTRAVYFGKDGVAGSGSRELCSAGDVTATLNVVYRDGISHPYTLSVLMPLHGSSGFAIIAAGLLILAFAIALFVPASADYLLLTLLIFIPSIPLFLLRDTPLFENDLVQAAIWIAGLAVAMVWLRRSNPPRIKLPSTKYSFTRIIKISGLLFILTIFGFYMPMKQHFYRATEDEAYHLITGGRPIWSALEDDYQARPYENLQAAIAYILSPDSLDGYLWIALFEHFLMAAMIFALARKFFPRYRSVVPLLAAILYIVWPSELWRFLVVEMYNYPLSLFLITLAAILLIHSYIYACRWLLLVACLLLGLGLLVIESGLPLAFVIPVLLVLTKRRPHLAKWAFAWFTTVGLLALRLVLFLASTQTYQTASLSSHGLLSDLPYNLWHLDIVPLFSFMQYPSALLTFGLFVLVTAVVAVGLLAQQGISRWLPRSRYLYALLLITLTLGLTILPYFSLNHYTGELATQPVARSQYFATPIQALFWAILVELAVIWLPGRVRRICLVGATVILVMLSTAANFQFQADHGVINRQVTIEGLTQSFHTVQTYLTDLQPNAELVFAMDDNVASPFGDAGHLLLMSCMLFNHPAYEGKFTADGFLWRSDGNPPEVHYATPVLTFQNPLVFTMTADWHISRSSMPAVTPSKQSLAAITDCADVFGGSSLWPPLTSFKGPGLRFFH